MHWPKLHFPLLPNHVVGTAYIWYEITSLKRLWSHTRGFPQSASLLPSILPPLTHGVLFCPVQAPHHLQHLAGLSPIIMPSHSLSLPASGYLLSSSRTWASIIALTATWSMKNFFTLAINTNTACSPFLSPGWPSCPLLHLGYQHKHSLQSLLVPQLVICLTSLTATSSSCLINCSMSLPSIIAKASRMITSHHWLITGRPGYVQSKRLLELIYDKIRPQNLAWVEDWYCIKTIYLWLCHRN